jgi:CRP-like cAMP-binding protein
MNIIDTLDQSDLFAGLPQAQLAAIAALTTEVTMRGGQALFEEGDLAKQLYILQEGMISIQVQLTSRPGTVTSTSLDHPGQVVGWSGFVQPSHYTSSAVCQSDCHLLAIDGSALMQLMEAHPATGFIVMRRLAELISGRLRNIQQFVLKTL